MVPIVALVIVGLFIVMALDRIPDANVRTFLLILLVAVALWLFLSIANQVGWVNARP